MCPPTPTRWPRRRPSGFGRGRCGPGKAPGAVRHCSPWAGSCSARSISGGRWTSGRMRVGGKRSSVRAMMPAFSASQKAPLRGPIPILNDEQPCPAQPSYHQRLPSTAVSAEVPLHPGPRFETLRCNKGFRTAMRTLPSISTAPPFAARFSTPPTSRDSAWSGSPTAATSSWDYATG